MKIYIVTEDLGDGDVGLRYFQTEEEAQSYINKGNNDPDYNPCWHESNPRSLDIDAIVSGTFKFNKVSE